MEATVKGGRVKTPTVATSKGRMATTDILSCRGAPHFGKLDITATEAHHLGNRALYSSTRTRLRVRNRLT